MQHLLNRPVYTRSDVEDIAHRVMGLAGMHPADREFVRVHVVSTSAPVYPIAEEYRNHLYIIAQNRRVYDIIWSPARRKMFRYIPAISSLDYPYLKSDFI